MLGGRTGRTTLSDPSIEFEVVNEVPVRIEFGDLSALLVNNRAAGPEHWEGYNGIMELRFRGGPSPFVRAYAGLNLEHVNNGRVYEDRDLQFEPRRHPMELRRIDERTYELYQAALPNTGLESTTRFAFREPYIIDVTFECIPRIENFPFDHLNVFWASYIEAPESKAIHFLGRKKGGEGEAWIEAISPSHGEQATHRAAGDRRTFEHEEPFALTLVFNESDYEYTRPFYYGRYGENVWAVMFREEDGVRLTQSPSGGGRDNPAWDFQWFIERPEKDRVYRMEYRAIYKKWEGREDIVAEYERFVNER